MNDDSSFLRMGPLPLQFFADPSEGLPEGGGGEGGEQPEGKLEDSPIDVPEGGEPPKEPKPNEEGKTEGGEEEPKKEGAPEAYEPFKVPEGVSYDDEAAKEFGDLAKELNLTQEQAQKLVDVYGDKQKAQQEQMMNHLKQMKESWVGDVKKAWGDNFDKQAALAVKGAELGDEAFVDLMNGRDKNLPGVVLADHPAIAGYLAKVGEMVSESAMAEGSSSRSDRGIADSLYGTVDVPGQAREI
nr:hypothetical protein [uncultured Dethiosulfovibrio sp.]